MPELGRDQPLKWIWFKVDNWDPLWPPYQPYGRVAEYDEIDNRWLDGYRVYLPIVFHKSQAGSGAETGLSCDPSGFCYGKTTEPERQSLDNGAYNVYDR
jgi:hypothetical protein